MTESLPTIVREGVQTLSIKQLIGVLTLLFGFAYWAGDKFWSRLEESTKAWAASSDRLEDRLGDMVHELKSLNLRIDNHVSAPIHGGAVSEIQFHSWVQVLKAAHPEIEWPALPPH